MKKDKFLEKIFSIKNSKFECGKTVTVFGFEFKFDISFFYKYIIKNTPVVENKILFTNFTNKGYGCNPKYIAQEIINQKLPYELVWIVKNPKKERKYFPKEIKLVKDTTLNSIKEHASAKIWISNHRKMNLLHKGLYKKDNQIYIQTWHGSLGIKKAEKAADNLDETYVKLAKIDSKYTNYFISNSLFEDETFRNNFWFDGSIEKLGHARNDIFFAEGEEKNKVLKRVRKNFNIGDDKKIALYVPTFRDSNSLDCYKIDFDKLFNALNKKYCKKDNWCALLRLHPNISKLSKKIFHNTNLVDATFYPDIQELLLCADIVISDYSSCIFDFLLTKKPAFIFATDLDKYNQERGFLYPLESTPFLIAKNNNELINNILNFDNNKYTELAENFLREKGCIDDGLSSARIVKLIQKELK